MMPSPWSEKGWLAVFLCLGLLVLPRSGAAFELQPLATRDLSPAAIGFGLPTLEAAHVLPEGRGRLRGTVDLVSNFTFDDHGEEQLFFDGETHRLALAADWGIGRGMEVGAELPLVSHNGGFLDSFIEGWHDFFGLPQGNRDLFPRDRLNYSYARSGGEGFQLDGSTAALGDLALSFGWQLRRDEAKGQALALRARLKLPTGDADKLTGSGGTDLALWLSAEQRGSGAGGGWFLYGGSGVLYTGDGELLSDQRRNLVGLLHFGLGWQPFSALGLQLQFDGHSSLYSGSRLKQMDAFAGQLAIGGSCALREGTVLELAVTEDVFVETVPDVGFHLALRQSF